MPAAGELTGPKVHVERVGTADSGAGQLVALGAELAIRAIRQTRSLGALSALQAIELQDRRGSVARLRFADGAVWLLTETRDDSLLPFLLQVVERAHRPELIAYPPSVSMQVREAMGPTRKREQITVGLGLLAIWPVAALCALLPWLGYVLIVAVVLWLVALALGDRGEIELPRRLSRLQWPMKLALPIMLSLAAALGVLHGRQRELAEQAAERSRGLAEQARVQAAARREQQDAARKVEIARAVADLQAAQAAGGDAAAIERHSTRLRALDPGNAALAELPLAAPAPKAPLSEEERIAAFASGLRAARRVTADRVRCDSARDVGDAWYGLRLARPEDPQLREAQKLTVQLERCRLGVRRALIDNAARVRKAELERTARQLEVELRSSGHAAAVTVRSSKRGLELSIVAAGMSAQAAEALLRPETVTSLERAGASSIAVGDGGRVRVERALSPPDLDAFARQTLAGFGLEAPLALTAS